MRLPDAQPASDTPFSAPQEAARVTSRGAGALSPPLVTRAVPAAVSVTSLNLLFSACDTGLVVANATPRPRGAKDMEAPRRAATGTCGEADTDGREEVTVKRAPRDRPHQGGVCTGGPAGKAADDGFLQDVGSCVPCTHHIHRPRALWKAW